MKPENFEKAKSLFLEGLSFFYKEQYMLAEKNFIDSLELLPDRLSTIHNLISTYIATNQKKKLKELLKKYVNLNKEKEILYGIAYDFYFDKEHSMSINLCKELLQYKDLRYSVLDLLASNYKKKKFFLDSLKIYRNKLREKKDYLIYYNIGCLFFELGRIFKAYYYFNKSRKYKIIDNSNLWNLSLCALTFMQLEFGFSLYEYRWLKNTNSPIRKFVQIKSPSNLKEIENKNILISDEQGLGDTLQFSRFVIDLLKYTNKITIVVNSKLIELLSNLHDNINIIDYKNLKLDNFNYHISLCSLPKFLKIKNINDINYYPLNIEYKSKTKIEKNNNLNIGLAWSGNPNFPFDEYRSINFKNFKRLLDIKDINFFKLSQNDKYNEYIDYNSIPNLFDFGNRSFIEIAKTLKELDLVVSCDTSIIHLAGILNIRSILLLNFNSDWRWFMDAKKTIWYPSVSIIKQKKFNSWDNVFNELEERIIVLKRDK